MNKEIKTDRSTGELVIIRDDYSFKQWGISHEIIDLIENLQQENKQQKEIIDTITEYVETCDYISRKILLEMLKVE